MSTSGAPRPEGPKAPPRVSRRGFLLAGVAVGVAGAAFAGRWFNVWAEASGDALLSAPMAHEKVRAGEITLVDIRRPDEWARTGVPEGALALDMRRPDFTDVLLEEVGGSAEAPIALICARGVRSRGLGAKLTKAGFTQIIDVPEGMLGSGAGPGWIKRGLPVVQVSD